MSNKRRRSPLDSGTLDGLASQPAAAAPVNVAWSPQIPVPRDVNPASEDEDDSGNDGDEEDDEDDIDINVGAGRRPALTPSSRTSAFNLRAPQAPASSALLVSQPSPTSGQSQTQDPLQTLNAAVANFEISPSPSQPHDSQTPPAPTPSQYSIPQFTMPQQQQNYTGGTNQPGQSQNFVGTASYQSHTSHDTFSQPSQDQNSSDNQTVQLLIKTPASDTTMSSPHDTLNFESQAQNGVSDMTTSSQQNHCLQVSVVPSGSFNTQDATISTHHTNSQSSITPTDFENLLSLQVHVQDEAMHHYSNAHRDFHLARDREMRQYIDSKIEDLDTRSKHRFDFLHASMNSRMASIEDKVQAGMQTSLDTRREISRQLASIQSEQASAANIAAQTTNCQKEDREKINETTSDSFNQVKQGMDGLAASFERIEESWGRKIDNLKRGMYSMNEQTMKGFFDTMKQNEREANLLSLQPTESSVEYPRYNVRFKEKELKVSVAYYEGTKKCEIDSTELSPCRVELSKVFKVNALNKILDTAYLVPSAKLLSNYNVPKYFKLRCVLVPTNSGETETEVINGGGSWTKWVKKMLSATTFTDDEIDIKMEFALTDEEQDVNTKKRKLLQGDSADDIILAAGGYHRATHW